MKEESRRKVLDNRVLRKTFEPIREEITGERKCVYSAFWFVLLTKNYPAGQIKKN
jgi:hypothetical protein